MRILVTGAAGFIGSALSQRLLDRGDEVIGIDNHNDYYDPQLKDDRLSFFKDHLNYTHHKTDLADRDKVADIFKKFQPQRVVNLAAQAGVRYSIENPLSYIDSNLVGFGHILEGCRHNNVEHLVYASSSSVYGANTKMPFSVNDNVDHPLSLYAATKKANELMAHTYSHLYNIPTTGLRFFTVYGPWDRPDMALQKFAHAIMNKKTIKVFNYGNHRRDFTYIDDIVKGVASSLDHCEGFEIYNLGNHKVESLMRLISLLEETLGEKAVLEFKPMQKGDVKTTFADIEKAKKDLGFCPTTSLEDGIKHFSKWFLDSYVAKV